MTQSIFDTLIVGAGPAGLTAGYLLTKEQAGTRVIPPVGCEPIRGAVVSNLLQDLYRKSMGDELR